MHDSIAPRPATHSSLGWRWRWHLHPLSLRLGTGVLMVDIDEAPSTMTPASVNPLGNYAVQIQWEDGFNQARPCAGAVRINKTWHAPAGAVQPPQPLTCSGCAGGHFRAAAEPARG